MSKIHAALEIGTTHTVLALGETAGGGRLKVLCHAEIPSAGVRKSQILDINQVTQSIRSVLALIEKKQSAAGLNVSVANAYLAVSGQHVKADSSLGTASVRGQRVTEEDLANVAENARQTTVLAKDRELLDIADQDYQLDSLDGIASPLGMTGRILKLRTLTIHGDRNRISDARTAASTVHLEIREPVCAATCAAEAVLEDYDKRNGVLVLDFGGGSTGYAVYLDGHLVTTGVVGVGGDHVTNDIANAFQTTQAQADTLKTTEASAMLRPEKVGDARVKLPGSSPLVEARTLSRRALDTVVNARMRELLAVIRDALDRQDLLPRLHAGVVLTGHGAALHDLDALVQREFATTVRIGRPLHVDGFADEPFPAAYATIAGALMYAQRNEEGETQPGLGGLFRKFFS